MQSTNLVQKESLNKVPTGLFVCWEKSSVLLSIVQNILRKRFKMIAETGPRENDNTCEIFLRALEPSGANFSASKDLLENYLDMIKESKPHIFVEKHNEQIKPNLLIEKQPEIIDLRDEDEDISCIVLDNSVNDSVTVVDLESPAAPGVDRLGRSEVENMDSCRRNMEICHEEVLVLDSHENKQRSLPDKVKTDSVLKDSTPTERKRKYQAEEKEIEVVDILDDDVIILDDSISVPECDRPNRMGSSFGDLKVTLDGDNRYVLSEPVLKIGGISKQAYINTRKMKKKATREAKKQKTSDFHCEFQSFIPLTLPKKILKLEGSGVIHSNEPVIPLPPPKKIQKLEGSGVNHSNEMVIPLSSSKKMPKLEDDGVNHLNEPEIIVVSPLSSTNNDSTNSSDTQSSASSHKKSSKFSYRRPAHLSAPLITSTTSEAPKADTATNIYNPNADQTEKRTGLRPIVIDANNVAVSHGKGQFSVKGIQICINYFEKRGHRQIKAFVPHYRKNQETFDALKKMEHQGTVVITPSRRVEGKTVASYDDRYIVQYASEVGGVIVSTDNYRDLMQENASWKETIDNRLLMFTWVDDLLMFPQDPLGRRGPSLEDFLKFPD